MRKCSFNWKILEEAVESIHLSGLVNEYLILTLITNVYWNMQIIPWCLIWTKDNIYK